VAFNIENSVVGIAWCLSFHEENVGRIFAGA
jgi:hypothetical protein